MFQPNDPLSALTNVNLDDLVNALGWKERPVLAKLARVLFFGAARKFAHQMVNFDSAVATQGLVQASRLTLKNYVKNVRVINPENIPQSAYLALSNHPGMTDTLALFAALNCDGLKIIARHRPFLASLTNISEQLFYVTENPGERIALVRSVSAYLRNGGAVLTFPAGHVEPDPAVYPGAVASLQTWTDSVGVFLRRAPETALLPILVRNVIWERAARHPILRIKRTQSERELLTVALQLLAQLILEVKPLTVKVQIGKPITVRKLGTSDTHVLHAATLAVMKEMIKNPPAEEGIAVL